MLEETLDRALQKTLYLHRVEALRPSIEILRLNVEQMFVAQSYDILWAFFGADLEEADSEDEEDRRVALILAAIAAALAARIDRDAQMLYPGLTDALSTALVQSALAKYGIVADLDSIRAEQWLTTHGAELVTGINETTREAMAKLLADAFARGDAIDDIASRLMTEFDNMTWPRARKIAITETSKAWSYAELTSAESMERAGYTMVKEWLLGPMHPRYDPCDHAHEQGAIPLRTPFVTGDMAPPQHPNCGCSLITYPATDQDQPWGTPVNGQTPFLPPFWPDRGDDNAR